MRYLLAKERRMVIMMTDCLYIGIQYLAALLEIGFLYIWLRAFCERRKLNCRIISIVILCSAAVRFYTNCMEYTAFTMIFEICCCFLISVLLFSERYRSLFFYTITNYALVITVEFLTGRFLNIAGFDWLKEAGAAMEETVNGALYLLGSALLVLTKMVLLYCIHYFMKKLLSLRMDASVKIKYTWKQCAMFYSIPIAACSFDAWINVSGDIFDRNIGMNFMLIIVEIACIMADAAVVYLHETLNAMMTKAQALEALNVRFEMEAKHYKNMDTLHEQYDVYIHDMKHMMRAIAALAEEGDCEKISGLIDKMRINIGNIEQKIICSNKVLNALLLERKGYAEDNGIVMEMEIREPLYFQEMDEPDFISLIGNLLDNAIEAEKNSKKREGILLGMRMAREGRHMIIQLENSYEENSGNMKAGIKRRGSIGEKHGIGLESVRNIVRKYGGIIENEKNEGRYLVKVILPVQSEWEGQKSYSEITPAYLQLLSK